jgi:hypothetical protein
LKKQRIDEARFSKNSLKEAWQNYAKQEKSNSNKSFRGRRRGRRGGREKK